MTLSADELRAIAGVDKLLHEPARLAIVTILYVTEAADFLFLRKQIGLTKGNLSAHLSRLEDAGYVQIEKMFEGKTPRTLCRLTDEGRAAFDSYRQQMKPLFSAL